jgi:PAS domain S-box-containing protein
MSPQTWRRLLPPAAAALALGGFLLAGGKPAQGAALGGMLLAVLAGDWPRPARWAAAAASAAGGATALLLLPADPATGEISRILAAAACLCALGRATDAALASVPRTGFWAGVLGTAVGAGGVAIVIAVLTARPPRPDAIAAALALGAAGAAIARAALAGRARASIGAWLGAGLGLGTAAGVAVGSVDLPRLGTASAAVPLAGAAMAVLGGRALHELGVGRTRRAVVHGLLAALLAALSIAALAWLPQGVEAPRSAILAGRAVQAMDAWWMPPAVSVVVITMVGLMLFTLSAAFARFGWTVGWLCGLLLAIAGSLGVFGWLVGAAVPATERGLAVTAPGSLSMVLLGFGAMQLASAALHRQKQRAVWLPALAAILLAGATVAAWREAARQDEALREERVSLALERATRGIREAIAARTESLGRIATALRLAEPARREPLFELEAGLYARDHPGTVVVFLAGPDRVVRQVHRVERAATTVPNVQVAYDPQRQAAYAEAEARGRAVMLGPLELSSTRGAGYLLIVPVQLDGATHFVVASGRYGALLDGALAGVPESIDAQVWARDQPVYQRRAAGDAAPEGLPRVATNEVLRTPWRVEMREVPQATAGASLPRLILFAGLLLATLFATTLRLSALARERAASAAEAAEAQLAAQRSLAASRAEAARVLDTMADGVLSLDRELRLVFANARARALLRIPAGAAQPVAFERLLPRGIGALDPLAFARLCRDALADGLAREVGGYAPDLAIWLSGRVQPGAEGVTLVLQDVTLARRAEVFEREQREILREIAEAVPLPGLLARVCSLFDLLHPGASCAVSLFDPRQGCLRGAVAPGLPAEYAELVDGLQIGPAAGSCGTAMHRRERVVSTDIARDPLWADHRGLAARFGLAACWAQPFLSRGGEPLGSLAVYWREPRAPSAPELSALETLAAICGIAVERDRSLRAQAESEQRFRSLFDHQPDGVFAFDLEGRVTAINEAVIQISGYPREAVLGQRFDGLVAPADRERVRGHFERAVQGQPQRYAARGVRADGAERDIDVTNLPIVVEGRIVGVYGVVRDVTEQRAAEARLLERDRFFELSPTVFAISDGRGRYTQVSDAFPRLLGMAREQLLATPIRDMVLPADVEPTMAAFREMQATGRLAGFVNRCRAADGGVRWLEWNALLQEDGSVFGVAIDITATMEARQQEGRLLRAIGEGPAVLWRFNPYRDPSTDMVTGNISRWGYAPEDFTSGRLRFVDLVHPDDHAAVVVADFARIEAGEDQFSREYRLRAGDGRWLWISEHLQVVRDAAGRLEFCLALAADVTEQRLAREDERQLRQVIELSPAVLWRFNLGDDVPTKLVSANVREWGYAPDDFTSGRVLFGDLVHPEDRVRIEAETRAAIEGGARAMQAEFRWRTADGRWLWLDERVTILRGLRGELLDCVSLTLDVTPQREALAAVRERDQFYALSLDVFAVVGPDARFRQVNYAMQRVLGFEPAAFTGRHVLDFVHPDDVPAVEVEIGNLAHGGRAVLVELRCRHADGGWRRLEWNAAGGAGGLFYCAARDVTEPRAVAAELRRALRDLELRNAELQDFAFVASHDLQEPLRKVQAFSDRLLGRYADQLDAQGADYLRRMDAAAGRMQSLIDGLLAYSRISTRGGSFREVDLSRVLDEVLADLDARLESTGGEVVRGPLPTVYADPTQMRQLLQNLVGNALKFTAPGRRPRVELRAEAVDHGEGALRHGGWRIVVADNGIGFDNAHAERIFAPFHRLHGRSEYEGTGMGLAIVRKIVERHGGTITATGAPGAGATFTVDLPGGRRDPARALQPGAAVAAGDPA